MVTVYQLTLTNDGDLKMEAVNFIIEDGLEIPPVKRNIPPSYEMYPFETMPVGSSFFVPESLRAPLTVSSHIRAFRVSMADRLGCSLAEVPLKFRTRKTTENGEGGIRVWRIE